MTFPKWTQVFYVLTAFYTGWRCCEVRFEVFGFVPLPGHTTPYSATKGIASLVKSLALKTTADWNLFFHFPMLKPPKRATSGIPLYLPFQLCLCSERIPPLYSSQKAPSLHPKKMNTACLVTTADTTKVCFKTGCGFCLGCNVVGSGKQGLTARHFQAGSWCPRATHSPLHHRTTAPLCLCKDRKSVI